MSLGVLFRFLLTGGFDRPSERAAAPPGRTPRKAPAAGGYARLALACVLAGYVLLAVVEDGAAHVFGVLALLAAAALAFRASVRQTCRTTRSADHAGALDDLDEPVGPGG